MIRLSDSEFLLGHQTFLKDHNKKQIFIGLITKELEKIARKDFYAILKRVTEISDETIRDEAHAIELYKELRILEIE